MFRGFNRNAAIQGSTGGNLPHWRQAGATYFVTFRLADSLPQEKLRAWTETRKSWLALHPRPWSRVVREEHDNRFTAELQSWLDAGIGDCLLAEPAFRRHVEATLWFKAEDEYALDEVVVASNHVHAIVQPAGKSQLSAIVQAWKSCAARRIHRGPIWQKESYDHIVRDLEDLARIRRYIRAHREWRPRDAAST